MRGALSSVDCRHVCKQFLVLYLVPCFIFLVLGFRFSIKTLYSILYICKYTNTTISGSHRMSSRGSRTVWMQSRIGWRETDFALIQVKRKSYGWAPRDVSRAFRLIPCLFLDPGLLHRSKFETLVSQ